MKIMTIDIIKGEHKDLIVRIEDKKTLEPFALPAADVSEILVKFNGQNGQCIGKKLTLGEVEIVSELGGKIRIILDSEDTEALKKGMQQDFEVVITKDERVSIAQFRQVLNVFESVCN
jgi:hypothetical protein